MKLITIAFTDGSTLAFRGDPIIEPQESVIIHNHVEAQAVHINWAHTFFIQVEEDDEFDEDE